MSVLFEAHVLISVVEVYVFNLICFQSFYFVFTIGIRTWTGRFVFDFLDCDRNINRCVCVGYSLIIIN